MASPNDGTPYQQLFRRNREWVEEMTATDPDYFRRRAKTQTPRFLFIGCSDSRVSAELLTGLEPGDMFVHRNIANLVMHSDLNVLSVLHFAVEVLKVRDVIVCGHHGCGGVRAAMGSDRLGLVDHWLGGVQEVMRLHQHELDAIADPERKYRRLVELNVIEQVYTLSRTPTVEAAWARRQPIAIHGMVYELEDGLLHDLGVTLDESGEVPQAHVSQWLEQWESAHPKRAR